MFVDLPLQGALFSVDFLTSGIQRAPEWATCDAPALEQDLNTIFASFPTSQDPNESQTEDDLIWKILELLGWGAHLRQQSLSVKGRADVPDGLLFDSAADKAQAVAQPEEWRRYGFGRALVEAKRWSRPLDRTSGTPGEGLTPSTQMLRYIRRADDVTAGKLRWGLLTNGALWRLYYAGAPSVSEDFFELDLARVLGIGPQGGLFNVSAEERSHWIKVFALMFGRPSFAPDATGASFHLRAIDEARRYEERVAAGLSEQVFNTVFPALVRAFAEDAPNASLDEVRDAALVFLYRLLFVLYAEDRDLLPVREKRYQSYSLRQTLRDEVKERLDSGGAFSSVSHRLWGALSDLCRVIDQGDASIGVPPYNGGLFDEGRTPLLARARLTDAVLAQIIDVLSFEASPEGRRYINYRDLSVQQLGAIYERLLERVLVRDAASGSVEIRPSVFARKTSGSYYTHDDLVKLTLRETLEPLIHERREGFSKMAEALASDARPVHERLDQLAPLDPSGKILELRICDPAMGSGHFLVALIDHLADEAISAMAEARALVEPWADYAPPLAGRIAEIRRAILANARAHGWTVEPRQLDDRAILRRMILKRCVYGVDKNPMAVELAKLALWLHSFTVGAPLSFLDHHLRCGDSLFGEWVGASLAKIEKRGGKRMFLESFLKDAALSAQSMAALEQLTDAEIAEAHRSAEIFEGIKRATHPLASFLSILQALDWMEIKEKSDREAVNGWLDGRFGDPVLIASGRAAVAGDYEAARRFREILERARALAAEEGFLHWQIAFPGVWRDWTSEALTGGFDAVVGNPPWDRIKLQQVEWFAARRPEIAMQARAADRARLIKALQNAKDPLAADYEKAEKRAEIAARLARTSGEYPLLSGGDINLYSLFVERAARMLKPEGVAGLVTPSGIASDLGAAPFFRAVATEGRLKTLYDFENRRTAFGKEPFFPDVDSRFKFCVMVSSPARRFKEAHCGFFLQDLSEIENPERCFPLAAADFARVNPNTGTAPVFRTRRDARLTAEIYGRLPVLVDRSGGTERRAWPVKYLRMFDMTNDSHLFRTRKELEETEEAWAIGGGRFDSPAGLWLPLYVGRMIHQFDHRSASVGVNKENLHNPALSNQISSVQKTDPKFYATPQYWVLAHNIPEKQRADWQIAFRDIARPTDMRTLIASIAPEAAFNNKLPLLLLYGEIRRSYASCLAANLNAIILDYVVRQKVHSTSLNWYIVEQLPVLPPERFSTARFGHKTAADIIGPAVLELTYTAHDMAPFARDMGYVDDAGAVRPPFIWNDARRLRLRAKLDALFFLLYGVTDREDVKYVWSTFPTLEREETQAHGRFLSRDLCLAYMNALKAGKPDSEPEP